MGAGQSTSGICSSVLEAKFQTFLMVMQQAWICGYRCVIFTEYNKAIHKLLTEKELHFSVHN